MDLEREKLVEFCRALGAGEERAAFMAERLSKRADQLADERGLSRAEALEHLLKVLVYGKRGEVYTGDKGDGADSPVDDVEKPHNQAD